MYCKLGKGTAALMHWDSLRFYSVWQTVLFEFRFHLCELNALMASVRKGRSRAREKGCCSQKFQLENAGLSEGKAVEGRVQPLIAQCMLAFPKICLYLTPHVTPLKTVFLTEPKQDLWDQESVLHRPLHSHREPVSLLYMNFWTTQSRLPSTLWLCQICLIGVYFCPTS